MGGGAWPFLVGGAICLEFLVSASHHALTTSLPFVHTARRSYRLNDPVKCSDRGDVGGSPSATSREVNLRKDHCRTLETERPENDETSLSVGRFLTVPADSVFWLDRTHSFRISPNPGTKSVKENATKQPAFANPETVFVRKQCCNVKSKTTLGNGYLGSRIDEERSEMRYLAKYGRETDSEQVPRGKDEKDFEKRVKECLKLSGGKRMGAGDASWSDAERSNPVCRSIWGVDRRGLRW
ncbi:hypothetical protein YC2023_002961 [Brassica napus]